jgi:hypothetical protein
MALEHVRKMYEFVVVDIRRLDGLDCGKERGCGVCGVDAAMCRTVER